MRNTLANAATQRRSSPFLRKATASALSCATVRFLKCGSDANASSRRRMITSLARVLRSSSSSPSTSSNGSGWSSSSASSSSSSASSSSSPCGSSSPVASGSSSSSSCRSAPRSTSSTSSRSSRSSPASREASSDSSSSSSDSSLSSGMANPFPWPRPVRPVASTPPAADLMSSSSWSDETRSNVSRASEETSQARSSPSRG